MCAGTELTEVLFVKVQWKFLKVVLYILKHLFFFNAAKWTCSNIIPIF